MTRPTLAQMLANGDLDRLFQQLGSWAAVAKHLGVNDASIRKARRKATERLPEAWEALGEAYQDTQNRLDGTQVGDFEDEEPTQPNAPRFDSESSTGLPRNGTRRPPDYPIPVDAIPLGFGVRSVSTGIDKDGNIEGQWLGARRNSENYEPIQPSMPTGHTLKGVSTLVDETGNVRAQWIKTSAQNDERQGWLDAIRDMGSELPRIEPTAAPAHSDDDLLAVYPVGDPHVGLLGWREDAGEDFDMTIAERHLVGAFSHLINLAPAAAQALLIFIGDNTHVDGQNNTTTAGTRQDADSRTVKMARTIIRICRQSIALALAKHGRVRMIVERGNHDELISAMVALALSLAYENEPRVEIDVSPEMYHWFRFDRVLIGTHHGDKAKPMDLLGVMAVDRADDWSETKHRRFYCGHLHHQIVKEVPGLIVEYLPTLAGSDAWHRSMGYRSQRAMYMDVFHREHGHINRHIVGIGQLRAA